MLGPKSLLCVHLGKWFHLSGPHLLCEKGKVELNAITHYLTLQNHFIRGCAPSGPDWPQICPWLLSCYALYCEGADNPPQIDFSRLSISRIKSVWGDWRARRGRGGNQDTLFPPQPRMASLAALSPLWLQPPLYPDAQQFPVSIGLFWPLGSRNCMFSHGPSSYRMMRTSCCCQRPRLVYSSLCNC